MMVYDISIGWIILAVIAYMVVGALWYSPVLFAEPWMKALGKKKGSMTGGNPAIYLVPALSAVLVSVMIACLGQALGLHGVMAGAALGFKLWLVFVVTTMLTNRVFQGGSLNLFYIDAGYFMVAFTLAGAIVLH